MMHYLSCKKIENDVYNFPTWQYCKYKDIFDWSVAFHMYGAVQALQVELTVQDLHRVYMQTSDT